MGKTGLTQSSAGKGRAERALLVSSRNGHNSNRRVIGARNECSLIKQQGSFGLDGQAARAGAYHRLQRTHADDRHVEAHVLFGLGKFDDGEMALGDLLRSDQPQPDEEVADRWRDTQVAEVLSKLPEMERNVIQLRFGLGGDEPRTVRQTGAELGITTSQAGELERRALTTLARNPELAALRPAA